MIKPAVACSTAVAATLMLAFAPAAGADTRTVTSPDGKTSAPAAGTAGAAPARTSFYTPPATLPAGNGTLVKSEKLNTLLNFQGQATRIMYTSSNTNGQQVAVTGTYLQPRAKWAGKGPRPVVSMSAGTIGQGDQCAPSNLMQSAIGITAGPSFGINYEHQNINNFLTKGVAVVLTDYIGLGTPGVHTYMDRVDQAHAVLDAARVARAVPGSDVKADSGVATYGYSQGGGASGAADELAPQYAPELKIKAGYVGAPPADLNAVLDGIDGSSIAGVAGYFINGLVANHPEVKPFLDKNINATGSAALAKVSNQCIADTLFSYGFHHTSEWTASGQPLKSVIKGDAHIMELVDAERIGRLTPSAPVRVATGTFDDVVPHAQAKQLAVDWCGKGANVTYAPIAGVNLGNKTALNHLTPIFADMNPARDWVLDRLMDKPVVNNCSQIASMK